MAPRPWQLSGLLLVWVCLCVAVVAASWAFVPWLAQLPPVAFANPVPLIMPVISAAAAGCAVFALLVALGFSRRVTTLVGAQALWLSGCAGLCGSVPAVFLLYVRSGHDGEGFFFVSVVVGLLPVVAIPGLLIARRPRLTVVVSSLCMFIAGGVLGVLGRPELVSTGAWGGLVLCVGLAVGGLILRVVQKRALLSRNRAIGRVSPLTYWGAASAALGLFLYLLSTAEVFAAAEPMLETGGYTFGDIELAEVLVRLRGLALMVLERAAILLGSLGIVLLVIRVFCSFFTTVSIGGVLVGSMALILVLSVMSGFENDLRTKILASNAHILVSKPDGKFTEHREVAEKLRKLPAVQAQSPFLISEVVIAARSNYSNVIIKGVVPETVGKVTEIGKSIEQDRPRPLDYLFPLSEEGEVIGRPGAGEPAEKPREGEESRGLANSIDAPPDDFQVPDFDPIDFSGEELPEVESEKQELGSELDRVAREKFTENVLEELDQIKNQPLVDSLDIREGKSVLLGEDGSFLQNSDSVLQGELEESYDLYKSSPEVAVLSGVLVGRELVKGLSMYVGQEVTVVSPLAEASPLGLVPRTKKYRVGGTFYTGMYEYDHRYVYVELSTLQDFLDLGDEVNGIEISVQDPQQTEAAVARIRQTLGRDYRVQDWRELNRSLFSALKLEKIAMFIVLIIVILVASFSIVGNLIMVVIEKAREIAVLKTLGASNPSIVRIFIGQGLVIGAIGTSLGVFLGLFHSMWTLSGIPLDPEVYYIDRLPVHVDPVSVISVGVAAMVISVAATIYPALLAASQEPVDGLSRE